MEWHQRICVKLRKRIEKRRKGNGTEEKNEKSYVNNRKRKTKENDAIIVLSLAISIQNIDSHF